ncbi:MAG: hypothetical protein WCA46_01005 [Actinocatenispora sp.]
MSAPPAHGWGEPVAAVLESVRFDADLDDAVLDRTAEAVVRTRMFHVPAGEVADAIRQALVSRVPLSDLVATGHGEARVRDFLGRLSVRLESLRPLPEWRYEQVAVAEWSSPQVRPVAYLGLSPVRVANQLGIGFERVTEAGAVMEMAVLRLADGALVALAREVGAPTTGTAVLVQGDGPGRDALTELFQQAGAAGQVTWLDGAAPRGEG